MSNKDQKSSILNKFTNKTKIIIFCVIITLFAFIVKMKKGQDDSKSGSNDDKNESSYDKNDELKINEIDNKTLQNDINTLNDLPGFHVNHKKTNEKFINIGGCEGSIFDYDITSNSLFL